MLGDFSWGEFLWVTGALCAIWYLVVGLLFYSRGLRSFFNGSGRGDPPPGWRGDAGNVPRERPAGPVEVMGPSRPEEGLEEMELEDLRFGPPGDGGAHAGQERMGLLADMMEEVRAAARVTRENDGSRQEYLALLSGLKARYPRIGSSAQLPGLIGFIREVSPFEISEAELAEIWK